MYRYSYPRRCIHFNFFNISEIINSMKIVNYLFNVPPQWAQVVKHRSGNSGVGNLNPTLPLFPLLIADDKTLSVKLIENWWKGKPSGSIACTRKQQPRFYWSRPSVVMNDATPLTHKRNSIFKCKQHTCTLHDPWGPEKYDYTMM